MDDDLYFSQLKDLVARGELKAALDRLESLVRLRDRDLLNEVILHRSSLSAMVRDERLGVITSDAGAVARLRLARQVLAFIDHVQDELKRADLPVLSPSVDFQPPDEVSLEKVFGISHLRSISWLRRGLEVSRCVGRISHADGMGTGFLVGQGRLLTNHHVIPDAKTAASSLVHFNLELDENDRPTTAVAYKLNGPPIRSSATLDYCLVDVAETSSSPALSTWGSLELGRTKAPESGRHVTIIQHPEGGPKQIALTANQVVGIYRHRLHYTTDTLPGSSGSPVFDDDWRVIALHHAGGDLKVNSRGDRRFVNEGILIPFILDEIEKSL